MADTPTTPETKEAAVKAEALDLVEAIESGEASEAEMAQAMALALAMPDAELLSVDPFQGDYEETAILSDKLVVGRAEYPDHYSRRPIAKGERHRVLRERTEDSIITTRHSILSLWMMAEGGDPSFLARTEARP